MAVQLRVAKLHLNKPQGFWYDVRADEIKVEMFFHDVQRHVL